MKVFRALTPLHGLGTARCQKAEQMGDIYSKNFSKEAFWQKANLKLNSEGV